MPLLGEEQWLFFPPIPRDIEALGISRSLVTDLLLRRLSVEGTSTIETLSGFLKLPIAVVHPVFTSMRQQQLVEVKGMVGNDYRITLSGSGRALASERLQACQYSGAAPVSLKAYSEAVKMQAGEAEISRDMLRAAFSDMVIPDSLLDQLGPSLIEQTSIFLYGPPGNGKSSVAERLLRVYQDAVLIPYAVEVDGQIVGLYDPVVHQRVGEEEQDMDPRWVPCRRPSIIVGGELTASSLDLRYDELSGIYSAPLQMKANNGIFVIDDFGRQTMSPRELLNRWIVPLDRRVDYLTLSYGIKFQIPFEMMVVFSTNLNPDDLADATFLRRIQNKVFVEPVDVPTFNEIWRRVAIQKKLPYDPEIVDYVRGLVLSDGRSELRACYPMDLCNIIISISDYEKRPPQMTKADLQRAVNLYFTQSYQKNTIDHSW